MAIRRSRKSSLRDRKNRGKLLSGLQRKLERNMQLERLEERQLLIGPQLIGIQPNDGSLLQNGDIRDIAPTDLVFRFDKIQEISQDSLGNSSQVGGIQITRSNSDGVFEPASVRSDFGTGGQVVIRFSAVRLGQEQNGIKLAITKSNFGGPGLPGISVIGRTININLNVNAANPSTAQDLVNAIRTNVAASNLIRAEILDTSTSLQPEAVNIAATAPANSSLTLGDPNNPNAVVANDMVVYPGFIGVGSQPALNEVVYRFAGQLPDDKYRIDIFGTGGTPLRNVAGERYLNGQDTSLEFELDLAPQILSVVPQPVERIVNPLNPSQTILQQQRSKIVVYFNDDNLNVASAQNRTFYQLIHSRGTLENTDDVVFNPVSVVYSASTDTATLEFGVPLDQLVHPLTGAALGPGTLRLRVGNDELKATAANPDPTPLPPLTLTPLSETTATYNGVAVHYVGQGEIWGKALRVEVMPDAWSKL